MRICIFGAGAVGGHLAVKLGISGHDVSVVARGDHLAAIQAKGLALDTGGRRLVAQVRASDRPEMLGLQDVVISTLKSTALPALAQNAGPLLKADTSVVFAHNGIPWWYGDGVAPARPPVPDLSRLDPGGRLRNSIGPHRAVGGVIYSANEVSEPGVVFNRSPERNVVLVGEIDGQVSGRLSQLRSALEKSGIGSPEIGDIRRELWTKLIQNLSASLLALLLEQPESRLSEEPMPPVFAQLWREAYAIATAHCGPLEIGANPPPPPTMNHKPSMLQDYEKRRPMEIEALIRTPLAFAKSAGLSTPALDVASALAIRRAIDRGLFGG